MTEKVNNSGIAIIEDVNLNAMTSSLAKIKSFQSLVQTQFTENLDFGVIPGTGKQTLLKPGAEKLIMLLGLTSNFDIMESTRDFEKGFFQYQIKCILKKGDIIITEGLGSANTMERKYLKGDPYTLDNTVLKMAKKRSLVDAALLVGSLSDIFTQDIEDMDLQGQQVSGQKTYYTDQDGTISKAQAKRMYAIGKGEKDVILPILEKYGYKRTDEVQKTDYEKICGEIEQAISGGGDANFQPPTEDEIPFK